MIRTRIIPVLLLRNESLVKTIRFEKFIYVGDPANSVRIFNELEVDELLFLDIAASYKQQGPNFKILQDIASECFMPLCYGGGINSLDQAKRIFDTGFEKIAINTHAITNPKLISEIANIYGSQAVIVSIDVKKNLFGKKTVRTLGGKKNSQLDPILWAKEVESKGAGEILLTSIDQEGTWKGFDIHLVKQITKNISIPVIAHGGAGTIKHISEVVKDGQASAVALGSMIVFQKKDKGVLINFPNKKKLEEALK
jgi:imidazole glycerol-phosphate synthase subunit HisF